MQRTALVLLLALLFLAPRPAAQTRFVAERTTVWLDCTQVVAFELAEPAGLDGSLDASSSDPDVLAVVRAAAVLAGERTGFVRVRGVSEGAATLRVGGAELEVDVRAPRAHAPLHAAELRVTGLVPGAAVWGKIAVGAELIGGDGGVADRRADVRLRLSDASLLAPLDELPAAAGPERRLVFELDAARLPAGRATVTAELLGPDGSTEDRSAPVPIVVMHPAADELLGGECEHALGTPAPEGFDPEGVRAGSAGSASGGGFAAVEEAWFAPVDVPATGRYQLLVRAAGTFGGGAFPSLGARYDDYGGRRTATRLVDDGWRRVPVGFPLELEQGEHTLVVSLLNRLRLAQTAERTLWLDRYELLRVDEGAEEGAGAMGMGMGMATLVAGRGLEGDYGADAGSGGLWIAFERAVDGLPVAGRTPLRGVCRWEDAESTEAPHVQLLLNGRVVASEQAALPFFVLDRAAYREGDNTLQMVATLPDGRRAATPVQTVHVGEPSAAEPRRGWRFGVGDERWDDELKGRLRHERNRMGHRVALFAGAGESGSFPLPSEIAGGYHVLARVRGPERAAVAFRVTLVTAEGERTLGEDRVQGWWNLKRLGEVELPSGPKSLRFTRLDEPQEGEEPGLLLRALLLHERAAGPDLAAPRTRLLYPDDGHVVHGADAVVLEVWDDEALGGADVYLDGRPQYSYARIPDGFGRLVVPLILRDVEPGPHTLHVRVLDEAGNVGESRAINVEVAADAPAEPGPYARAVHLLDRFGYGPEPQRLAEVLVEGERAWLARRLAEPGAGDAAALGYARAQLWGNGQYDTAMSTLHHALRTDNPARTRLVAWVENHFSTWMGKTQGPAEWREHDRFLALGAAPFAELLIASATSPAMLYYLDQPESYAARLNENYAREILELHTLGVDGGYTQADVTSLAGLLAGLTLAEEASPNGAGDYMVQQLRYAPELSDARSRDVLGLRFRAAELPERFGRVHLALELLAAHPSTAGFVSRKLAEHYVAAPAPEGLVTDLTRTFRESGGDLRALLLALAEHPDFWAQASSERLATPYDFGLRLARTAAAPEVHHALNDFLNRSGMGVFDRETPDGYPEEDEAWLDTNGTMQRWSFASQVPWAIAGLLPNQLYGHPAGDAGRWEQRVIDFSAVALTGHLLGERSNRAAREHFSAAEGQPWQRAQEAAVFVTKLPEVSLR
ncbi:MAG: DUF1800 family protein [Planctomycetota bacterium]